MAYEAMTATAAIADIAKWNIGATDATALRQLAVQCYRVGMSSKGNAPADVVPIVEAFDKRFRAEGTGRRPLKESSQKTYNSAFGAYAELGFAKWIAADRDKTLDWCLDNLSQAYGTRAKIVKAIAALPKAPAVETKDKKLISAECAEIAVREAETKNGMKEANVAASALLRTAKGMAIAATPKDGTPKVPARFADTLRSDPTVWSAYGEMLRAILAFQKATTGETDELDALLAA